MAIRDPERYFDRRTIKRHLKRGHASEEDYKAYLAALPDLGDAIKPKDEGGDDDGFEARMDARSKREPKDKVKDRPKDAIAEEPRAAAEPPPQAAEPPPETASMQPPPPTPEGGSTT